MYRLIRPLCLTVVLAMAAWLTAATKPATKPASAARAGMGTTAQADVEIEKKIREKLAKSKIGADHFQVHVQGGIATWEGETSVIQHKGAATRMAKTAGAKAVVNNIKISDEARQKAADNLATGRRRAQVTRGEKR